MNHDETIQLMHAVLDGEATADESRALDRILAAEPALRAEYDELRRLFDGLSVVPKAFAPEGLVASVMAQIPERREEPGRFRQLFSRPRVIRQTSSAAPETTRGKSARVHRASQQGPIFGSDSMSEDKGGSFGKRKVWIGGGIAAAAVILAVSAGIDFPPSGKDTAGTIVPAQRFRAPQNTADDVKLGNPSGTQSTTIPAAGDASRQAAGKASG